MSPFKEVLCCTLRKSPTGFVAGTFLFYLPNTV